MAGHWYHALKDIFVAPASDDARNLDHLLHLIKIMQSERIVTGNFQHLPNYHLRPSNYHFLGNYAAITEQKLRKQIKEERIYRFQIVIGAIQDSEARPSSDPDSCYVL